MTSEAAALVVALCGMPRMGPRRLGALLEGRTAEEAFALARRGAASDPGVAATLQGDGRALADRWSAALARVDPAALLAAHREAGVQVLLAGDPGWPASLDVDPEPPAVLFLRGDPAHLRGVGVAVVGTRRCTRYGRDVAIELGRGLGAAGVRVVSGLAIGIDGAAHDGCLAVPEGVPVGVVGNGLDVTYPRRHAELYREVAARGALLSEYPLGAGPKAWTFPARNRLIAALASVVVVVESAESGGSMYTVDEAVRRDRPVLAVPGSIRSPASVGTNRLIADGAEVVCDVADVLTALGLHASTGAADDRPPVHADDRPVLDAVDWEPTPLETIALRTGLDLDQLQQRLGRLSAQRWLDHQGAWFERR